MSHTPYTPRSTRLTHLKIKIKSLVAEQGIILDEERRLLARRAVLDRKLDATRPAPDAVLNLDDPKVAGLYHAGATSYERFTSIQTHRHELGQLVRRAMIAYCFLRGITYARIERTVRANNWPNFDLVAAEVRTFAGLRRGEPVRTDPKAMPAEWADWRKAAEEHLNGQKPAEVSATSDVAASA